jgi:hypothetical protein
MQRGHDITYITLNENAELRGVSYAQFQCSDIISAPDQLLNWVAKVQVPWIQFCAHICITGVGFH